MYSDDGINKSEELRKIRGIYDFKERNKKLDFRTSALIDTGMNYNQFVKIHNRLVQYDMNLIGADGCYLLFYLIAYAHNRTYFETTIGLIGFNIKMTNERISNMLQILHKNNLISIKEHKNLSKTIGINEILQIVIIYDNDILYDTEINSVKEGYKAIPIDYIKDTITKVNPIEFSILLILILRFRYYLGVDTYDDLGQVFHSYKTPEYAFPNLDQISGYFNSTRKTVKKYIMSLADKKFISYELNGEGITKMLNKKTGEFYTINSNYLYRVALLQRLEYMYYNYYILPDTYKNNTNKQNTRDIILKELKSKGFDRVAKGKYNKTLLAKDYIKYAYSIQMSELNTIIKNNDIDRYNKKDKKLIQDYKNVDATSPEQKIELSKKLKEKNEKS